MLKVFLGVVVSVVFLLSSAFIPWVLPKVYAASATVLITQIQAGSIGAATQEFIVIYNNSPDEVAITNWCLTSKSNANIACFIPPIPGQALYLPAYRHAVVASSSLAIGLPTGTVTHTYVPGNQSSGSITGSSDTISLVDRTGLLVDRQAWTVPINAGMQFERHSSGYPVIYTDTDTAADWLITLPGILPVDETVIDTTMVDVCPTIGNIQVDVPMGSEVGVNNSCVDKAVVALNITEILPNAVGSDDGQEFIELFNPNAEAVSLAGYELHVGPQYENSYDFPFGTTIEAHSYLSFSNAQIPFSLLNSSSLVALTMRDGTVVSSVPGYSAPKDGESWALIDDVWQYTNLPTPSSVNSASDKIIVPAHIDTTVLPCATNQFRSIETNRCRLVSSTVDTVVPCKDGQYRSEETHRCRTIAAATIVTPCNEDEQRNEETHRCRKIVATSTPTPCKEGQERSPDTNRCKTVTKMPNADYAVLGTETKSGGQWYVWATVGGILLIALGYAIWEWHDEMGKFFRQYYFKVVRFARLRK